MIYEADVRKGCTCRDRRRARRSSCETGPVRWSHAQERGRGLLRPCRSLARLPCGCASERSAGSRFCLGLCLGLGGGFLAILSVFVSIRSCDFNFLDKIRPSGGLGVVGSNPAAPTIKFKGLAEGSWVLFRFRVTSGVTGVPGLGVAEAQRRRIAEGRRPRPA